ncbi:unnamed protein product [Polarella glacialis]|uniref:Uncharacterized protein n=1 Tax=Polarella glacialis TaxID=89957 RepID=A0A813H7W2_POLGL|nr:unnamed protein product [Polarella glacialis]
MNCVQGLYIRWFTWRASADRLPELGKARFTKKKLYGLRASFLQDLITGVKSASSLPPVRLFWAREWWSLDNDLLYVYKLLLHLAEGRQTFCRSNPYKFVPELLVAPEVCRRQLQCFRIEIVPCTELALYELFKGPLQIVESSRCSLHIRFYSFPDALLLPGTCIARRLMMFPEKPAVDLSRVRFAQKSVKDHIDPKAGQPHAGQQSFAIFLRGLILEIVHLFGSQSIFGSLSDGEPYCIPVDGNWNPSLINVLEPGRPLPSIRLSQEQLTKLPQRFASTLFAAGLRKTSYWWYVLDVLDAPGGDGIVRACDLPPMRLAFADGSWWSLDNHRLYAYKLIEQIASDSENLLSDSLSCSFLKSCYIVLSSFGYEIIDLDGTSEEFQNKRNGSGAAPNMIETGRFGSFPDVLPCCVFLWSRAQ